MEDLSFGQYRSNCNRSRSINRYLTFYTVWFFNGKRSCPFTDRLESYA